MPHATDVRDPTAVPLPGHPEGRRSMSPRDAAAASVPLCTPRATGWVYRGRVTTWLNHPPRNRCRRQPPAHFAVRRGSRPPTKKSAPPRIGGATPAVRCGMSAARRRCGALTTTGAGPPIIDPVRARPNQTIQGLVFRRWRVTAAITAVSSTGSTGFVTCAWNPAARIRARSSARA